MKTKMKTKTTIELTTKELIRALEKGTFTDRKIKNIEWIYRHSQYYSGGNDGGSVVVGAILEVVS